MATAKIDEVKDDFLTCSICAQVFHDPCTLPCQHTFCRACLTAYIQSRPSSRTITCPYCRQVTSVPDPSRPVEEWSEQFKPAILLQGLLDSLGAKITSDSTEKIGRRCTLCDKLGEATQGVSWCPECQTVLCDRCTKLHQLNPTSANHTISVVLKHGRICDAHKDHILEFHCHDCKKPLCQSCRRDHKKCASVSTISSMRDTMLRDLKSGVDQCGNSIVNASKASQELKDGIASIEQQSELTETDIRMSSEQAMEKIQQREQELMKGLNSMVESKRKLMLIDLSWSEASVHEFDQRRGVLQSACNADSNDDVYDVWKTLDSGQGPSTSSNTVDRRRTNIKFAKDKSLDDPNHFRLGEVRDAADADIEKLGTPVLLNVLPTKLPEDTIEPDLRDIQVLDLDGSPVVVVSDWINKSLKSFYTLENQSGCSHLMLSNPPFGVTSINRTQVMVAIPGSLEILTVSATPTLKLISTIHTNKMYCSLASLNLSLLAAGSGFSRCIDVLNMSGTVMKSVQQDCGLPWYLCADSKDNIFVSDSGRQLVNCKTGDYVIFKYAPAGRMGQFDPRGIKATSTRGILLANNKSGTVIQFDYSGLVIQECPLGQGIEAPRGLCLYKQNQLFVCCLSEIRQYALN